jgi:hypothetical protein
LQGVFAALHIYQKKTSDQQECWLQERGGFHTRKEKRTIHNGFRQGGKALSIGKLWHPKTLWHPMTKSNNPQTAKVFHKKCTPSENNSHMLHRPHQFTPRRKDFFRTLCYLPIWSDIAPHIFLFTHPPKAL